MSTVYMTVGIPASGKTTWAKKTAASDKRIVIVSRDDIRAAHGWVSGFDENRVTRIHRAQIEAALLEGLDVIVADTNINKTFRNRLIKFCHEHGADVVLVPFNISLDEAILRDSKRTSHKVGPQVIKKFYDDLQAQEIDEAIYFCPTYDPYQHRLSQVCGGFGATRKIWDEAVIVDIDGTLARMDGRSPYDESRVGEDEFVEPVANAVQGLASMTNAVVIVVSGRTEGCRELTEKWLEENDFEYGYMYMRQKGDQRPDYIVKNEIYDKHIIPNYNIQAVFDDRDQVVRHLRRRGITVFQVAPGRF